LEFSGQLESFYFTRIENLHDFYELCTAYSVDFIVK